MVGKKKAGREVWWRIGGWLAGRLAYVHNDNMNISKRPASHLLTFYCASFLLTFFFPTLSLLFFILLSSIPSRPITTTQSALNPPPKKPITQWKKPGKSINFRGHYLLFASNTARTDTALVCHCKSSLGHLWSHSAIGLSLCLCSCHHHSLAFSLQLVYLSLSEYSIWVPLVDESIVLRQEWEGEREKEQDV